LIFLIFLTSCTKHETIIIDTGERKISISVEIADTQEKRQRGLMFRGSLDEYTGMFFTFDKDAIRKFWMKNTLIPLDMIFISQDFEIVNIEYAEPCTEEPCRLYNSSILSRYVLEVNGNFTIVNNIDIGDMIIIE